MVQNINLYNLTVSGDKFNFTVAHMLKLGVVLLVVLSLFSVYLTGAYFFSKYQVMQLKKKQAEILQNIEQSISTMPSKEEQEGLAKKIAGLEEIKKDKQKIFVTLSGLQYGEKKNFSTYLEALSTNVVSNVWFTVLKITANGKFITLTGKTTDSNNISKLMKRISGSGAFGGKTFDTFSLTTDEAEPRVMNFIMKSE